MSSLQSLRELISERLAAAAEEICRLCEGTIVQYEQELCRQRRLLDVIWKPQLQLHNIVLPQHWMTEEKDLCNQQRNFRVEQEEPEPPQTKEKLQSFNVTDSQDEEGNQHEESTSTTDEETDPQNRDQRKRRDRSHVQSVDSSHMSAVLPQHWVTENEDLCNRQRNYGVELEKADRPHYKEELEEPEPSPIKEEQEGFYNSQLDLKQETDTVMEIPTYEEDENSEADLNNQQRNFRVEQEEPEPLQNQEEQEEPEPPQIQEEPEPPQIKEEPGELCISQDEDQLDLKQETDTLMEIPTYEEDEKSEADQNNQQSFNVTDSQDEEGNQHEESTSTIAEETESTSTTDAEKDRQNRDQRKRKKKSCLQCVYTSHMSERECDSHGSRKGDLVKKRKESSKQRILSSFESGENSRMANKPFNVRFQTGEKQFSCKECDESFSQLSDFQKHMSTHTGGKPFSCIECAKRFSDISSLKTHISTHTGGNPFSCIECAKCFRDISSLKTHMRTHTGEKPFLVKNVIKVLVNYQISQHTRVLTQEESPFLV